MKTLVITVMTLSIFLYAAAGVCGGSDYFFAEVIQREDMKTAQDIADWLWKNIEYKDDYEVHGVNEYWQMPLETFELKTGDCEDIALLGQALLKQIKIDTTLVLIYYNYEEVGHACLIFEVDEKRWGILDNFTIWNASKKRYKSMEHIVEKWFGAEMMDIRVGKGK